MIPVVIVFTALNVCFSLFVARRVSAVPDTSEIAGYVTLALWGGLGFGLLLSKLAA